MAIRDNFSYTDMEEWLDAKRVTEIECLVPDLTGVARGKILPRVKFTDDRGMRLPEVVLGMTVTGNTPERDAAYERAISSIDRDMILRADPSTITMVPWAADPTAQVIHDCYYADGKLVDFAPRSVLRRVLKLYEQRGWKPVVAPELEFYLTAKNIDPDLSPTALSQLVCTFAESSAGAGGHTVLLGGPGGYAPKRYRCTTELRERPESTPPTAPATG